MSYEPLRDEVESLRQQLAAAIAACKLKDDDLEKIRGHIGLYNLFSCVGSDSYDPECADLNAGKCREIATKAIAIQPDDSALKAWLGEPVARLVPVTLPDGDRVLARTFEEYSQESSKNNMYRNGPEIPLYSPKELK